MLPLQQRENQQPVFKPLSTNENAMAFTLETSIPRLRVPVPSLSRSHELQLPSLAQRQITDQDQVTGTERLASLHAKLHQEADKIRKWKVQIEIDLKNKEKKIQEAAATIENLRKSILDLQLHNEKLSLKLQDETSAREITTQKILATRELCNVLKDHTMKLEERLAQCESERTELKYVGKEYSQQVEELSTKFKELEISATDDHNSLVNQLQLQNEARKKLEENMVLKLGEAETQLRQLMDKCDEKDIEIRNVRTIMQKNEDKIYEMELLIGNLQKQLSEQVSDIETKQKQCDESSAELESLKEVKCKLEKEINNVCLELSEIKDTKLKLEQTLQIKQNKHEEEFAEMHNEVQFVSTRLQKEKKKNAEYEQLLSESSGRCEKLKSSRDILVIEKTELENKIVEMQKELDLIKEYYNNVSEKMKKLQDEYAVKEREFQESSQACIHLQNEISQLENIVQEKEQEKLILHDKLTSLKDILDKNVDDLQKAKEHYKNAQNKINKLQEEVDNITDALNVERKNVQKLSLDNLTFKKDLETSKKLLAQKDKDFNKMIKECEKKDNECQNLKDSLTSLKAENENISFEKEKLLTNVEELQTEIAMLKEERVEVDISVTKEIKSKTQKMIDLEVKVKELKTEATHKNRQIKEYEKEIKSIKNKTATQAKEIEEKDKLGNILEEELQKLKSAYEELEKKLNVANQTADKERILADECRKKITEMERCVEMALKEKQEAVQKYDLQFAEMMATLDKYKQENLNIISQKEKELELLRSKSDDLAELKQQNNKKTEDWKAEIEKCKKEAEDLKLLCQQEQMEKNHLTEEINKKNEAITKLETDLSAMKQEIKDLKKKSTKTESKIICCDSETQTVEIEELSTSVQNRENKEAREIGTPVESTLQEVHHTPIGNMKTPHSVLQSVQRTILKNVSSLSKRRKVAFSKLHDPEMNPLADSDSSTELMEIEMEDIDQHLEKSTPLRIRPSPKLRTAPEKVKHVEHTNTSQQKSLTPKSDKEKSMINKEQLMFKGLYPDSNELCSQKQCRIMKENAKPFNMRKAPNKSSKFFKERATKKTKASNMKKPETEDLAWFDLDSVFGFGSED